MFYSCSHSPDPRPTNLDAISHPTQDEDTERRARHLAISREVIDLTLTLTRAAAGRARDAAEAEAECRATLAKTPRQAAKPPRQTPVPTPRTPDPDLTFHRLSRGLLQAMAFEARIAAGAFNRAPARAAALPEDTSAQDAEDAQLIRDANHCYVSGGLAILTENHPDRWTLRHVFEDTVAASLADHPEDPLPTHFARVCKVFGITPNVDGFPDHLAEALQQPDDTDFHLPPRTPDG